MDRDRWDLLSGQLLWVFEAPADDAVVVLQEKCFAAGKSAVIEQELLQLWKNGHSQVTDFLAFLQL